MAKKAEDTFDALTNDRRTEMANVQFLGNVRPAVVDDDLPGGGPIGPERLIERTDVPGQVLIGQGDVDETRSREFELLESGSVGKRIDYRLSNLARVLACPLRCSHRTVALELGKVGTGGNHNVPESAI
jgi:hypothetical protein